jgi:hypothetical protein
VNARPFSDLSFITQECFLGFFCFLLSKCLVREVPSTSHFSEGFDPMIQQDLEAAVSRATGENLREIRRRGFSMGERPLRELEPSPGPQWVDWDAVETDYRQPRSNWPAGW